MSRLLGLVPLVFVACCGPTFAQSGGLTPGRRVCTPEATRGGVIEFSEVAPELIGGLAGLQQRLVYPDWPRRMRIQGMVVVRFVVGLDGLPCDVVVARPVDPDLDRSALDAVYGSRFTPARQNGQPVAIRFTLPVRFSLAEQ